MTTREEYLAKYDELYGFITDALVASFSVTGEIGPDAVLSDDLGLEPLEWFRLSDMVAEQYAVSFEKDDLILFDWDLPTIDEFARMVLVKLGFEPPLDYGAFAAVSSIIEDVTGIETVDIAPYKELKRDLEIDSMSLVMIATQCEDEFGIKITDEALFQFNDVRDITNYVSSQKLAPVTV